MTWKEIVSSRRGQVVILFCIATLLMMVFYMPHFYREVIAPKEGLLLNDPILQFFSPKDWSLLTFGILYLAVIQTVVTSYRRPSVLLIGLTAYCAINVFRMLTMYWVTLEPASDMILLSDPISSIAYPEKGFAKDLFFSGHISTMVVLVLVEEKTIAKLIKIFGTVLMGVLLAWQHVHYTIDLLAAPLVAYFFFALARKILSNRPAKPKLN